MSRAAEVVRDRVMTHACMGLEAGLNRDLLSVFEEEKKEVTSILPLASTFEL